MVESWIQFWYDEEIRARSFSSLPQSQGKDMWLECNELLDVLCQDFESWVRDTSTKNQICLEVTPPNLALPAGEPRLGFLLPRSPAWKSPTTNPVNQLPFTYSAHEVSVIARTPTDSWRNSGNRLNQTISLPNAIAPSHYWTVVNCFFSPSYFRRSLFLLGKKKVPEPGDKTSGYWAWLCQ